MKVAQRLDDGQVRCIATGEVGDLKPGANVLNTRSVGLGLTPMDSVATVSDDHIPQAIRIFAKCDAKAAEILETGIKPIDLFCPLAAGGTVGLFGIQGVGRIVLVEELIWRLADRGRLAVFYLVHRNEPDSVRDMLTKEKGYAGDVTGGMQVVWVLNDIATDPDAAVSGALFDTSIYCSPVLGVQGLYPAIDPLASSSRMLEPRIIGREHCDLVGQLRELLSRAKRLMADPVMLEYIACRARPNATRRAEAFARERLAELSHEDRLLVSRARKIERFLTTPFFMAEPFRKSPGHFVSRGDTIRGCQAILNGEYDAVPEERFCYIARIEEARQMS